MTSFLWDITSWQYVSGTKFPKSSIFRSYCNSIPCATLNLAVLFYAWCQITFSNYQLWKLKNTMKFQSQDLLLNQSLENLVTSSVFCISSICFGLWCLCETSVLCSGSVEQRRLEVVFYWFKNLRTEVRQILRPVFVKVGTKWGSQMFELFYMLLE